MDAQLTAEAEYIVVIVLGDMEVPQLTPTVLWMDNKSTISITKNPVQYGRTKHKNMKFYAIHEVESNQEIHVEYCSSEFQVADIMTLPKFKFEFLRKVGSS